MNGRIYDPLLGRFLSADLIVHSAADLQSFNRYSYVRNNPLTLTDPTGFDYQTDQQKNMWQMRQHAKELGQKTLKEYDAGQTKTVVSAVVATALNLALPGFGSGVATRILSSSLNGSVSAVSGNMAGNVASGKPVTEGNTTAAVVGAVVGAGVQTVAEAMPAANAAPAAATQGSANAGTPTPSTAPVNNAAPATPLASEIPAAPATTPAAPATASAAPAVPPLVYRGGGKNPGNLTPRPVDQGMLSTRDSLSNPWPLAPGQKPPLPAGQPIQVIDTSKLPAGSVVPDGAPNGDLPAGHVSIGPNVPADVVKDAIVETIPKTVTQ